MIAIVIAIVIAIAIARSYICFMANDSTIIHEGRFYYPSSKTEVRPVFMEPLPAGEVLLPRYGGHYRRRRGIIVSNDNSSSALRMRKSSFPIKDDAGYIGYLSDDDDVMKVLNRRRRELMGSDITFSDCMFMMVAVGGLLLLFLFAVSPWGVPPPRRL